MKNTLSVLVCPFFSFILLAFSLGVHAQPTATSEPSQINGQAGETQPEIPPAGGSNTTTAQVETQPGANVDTAQRPPQLPPPDYSPDVNRQIVGIMGFMPMITDPEARRRVAGAVRNYEDQRAQIQQASPPGGPEPGANKKRPGPLPRSGASQGGGSGNASPVEAPALPPAEQAIALRTVEQMEEAVALEPPQVRRAVINYTTPIRINAGDHKGALRNADEVLRQEPDNRDALNNRALGHYGMGQYKEAVQDTTRLVEMDEGNQRAYTTRALAYYEMKDYVQALEDANRALALDKNNQLAHQIAKLSSLRVVSPERLGLDSKQQAAAERLQQEYDSAMEQRNRLEASSGGSLVLPASAKAAAPVERVVDSLNRQAKGMITKGDVRGALESLNQALERSPRNPTSLQMRAGVRNMMGEYEMAVMDADEALKQAPEDVDALDARASALLHLGRLREAQADADRAIAANPKSAYAYMTRARIKEQLHDLAGMSSDLKMAARLSPQFETALQKAALKYGLPLGAEVGKLVPASPAPAVSPPPAETPAASRGPRFLVVLLSSVGGGLLIALGLVHVVLDRQNRRGAKLKEMLPGAGPETLEAIGSGPALHAGYNVLRAIGNGGMGVVYEAVDKALGRKVAIKQMRREIAGNPREREHFLQEARIVAALHHPNIVDIHSIVEDQGDLCMVFEFVEGRTVEELLCKKGKLSVREAQYVVRGVCNALDFAHKKGVIHRDLKPSNIMVTNEGRVKVMDFGIARQAKDAMLASTSTQTVAGTPLYMAPEQEQGIVRKESDIFALGACLYEMVTGIRPFQGPTTTASKLAKSYTKPSRVTDGLPGGLDALIDAALEPDPDRRIRSAADFAARLESLQVMSA